MPSTTLSTYNSSLATHPLRGFRFTASFQAASADIAGVFDKRIKDASAINTPSSGVSTGWVGGFTNVSGLNINTQSIQYREGGYATTVHQIPGMTTFNPITFTRGVLYGNDQAITWMRGLFTAAQGSGLNSSVINNPSNNPISQGANFRVDVILTVNQHPNTNATADIPVMRFKIHNAWITNLAFTDLDATNGAILFETMQLVHEGLSVFFTDSNGNPVDGLGLTAY